MGEGTCLSLQHGHHMRTRWLPPEGTCNREKWWEDHGLVSIKTSPGERVLEEEMKCRHDASWMDPHPECLFCESHEQRCSRPPGCPARTRCFWCSICSGTPVAEKLKEEWPLPWSQAWLSSFISPPPLPHILPARRTVTQANYTVTGEEKKILSSIYINKPMYWGITFKSWWFSVFNFPYFFIKNKNKHFYLQQRVKFDSLALIV